MKWLASFPTTNARIAATIVMAFGTCGRVVAMGWEPPWAWLAFLIVWAGLDVTQFGIKRRTHIPNGGQASVTTGGGNA